MAAREALQPRNTDVRMHTRYGYVHDLPQPDLRYLRIRLRCVELREMTFKLWIVASRARISSCMPSVK